MKKVVMAIAGLLALGNADISAAKKAQRVKKVENNMVKPMKTLNTGLSMADAMRSSELLNRVNGDLSVLLFQAYSVHWNYTGPDFNEFHELFGKQYEQISASIDTVAERIRALEAHATATMSGMLSVARLKEHNNNGMKPNLMISAILEQYEEFIRTLRGDLETVPHGDVATKVILEDLLRSFEKMAWMVRSHNVNQ